MSLQKISMLFLLFLFQLSFADSLTCVTSRCHTQTQKNYVHGPTKAKGCVICHQIKSQEGSHPKFIQFDSKKMKDLCFTCHDEMAKSFKKSPIHHTAINEKGCTACHNPHNSPNHKLLRENPPSKLCLGCHENIRERKISHNAQEKECLGCHATHFSKHEKMLKINKSELCFECHKKEIQKGDKKIRGFNKSFIASHYQHTPFKQGDCLHCHLPHGSDHESLLIDSYSDKYYFPHQDESSSQKYCYRCHPKSLGDQKWVTKNETHFRNGSLNLHWVHLKNENQSRSCKICHDIHTSENFISSSFEFKGYQIPLQYKKMDRGGNCTTLCHVTLSYERDKK